MLHEPNNAPENRRDERARRLPIDDQLLAAGRRAGPELLLTAWWKREITADDLRARILGVWGNAEWPAHYLQQRDWLELFATVGYVDDFDEDSSDEAQFPLTVYRGAALGHGRGFSWTWDPQRARWFAERTALFGFEAAVFAVSNITRDRVLATIGGGRREREVIINPRRLRGRWAPRELERLLPASNGDEG